MVGIAFQRLDTAECHHHGPRRVTHVGSQRQPFDDAEPGRDFPAGNQKNLIAHGKPDERVVDHDQALDQRCAHSIREFQRRGPGPTLGPIHRDEIGRDAGFDHRLTDGDKLPPSSQTELEANRFPTRQLSQFRNEFEQPDGRRERRVRRWRQHIFAHRNVANLSNLLCQLGGWQNPAVCRFGTLGQLDLDHFHVGQRCALGERVLTKLALVRAAAKIARPYLPDQIATASQMVGTDAAFAGVVREVAHLGSLVQRKDGILAQGAEAHGRNIENA